MRPFVLDPLFRGLSILPGVGSRNSKLLEKLAGGPKVLDLLWHLPIDLVDRRIVSEVSKAIPGHVATLEVKIEKHYPPGRRNAPYKVKCVDRSKDITLIFFRARPVWLQQQLPEGAVKIISGQVDKYGEHLQMVHPDVIAEPEEIDRIAVLEPVYPLTQGINNKTIRKAVEQAVEMTPDLNEWQDPDLLKKRKWPAWKEALGRVHYPKEAASLDPYGSVRQRLAYDELLASQLALGMVRQAQTKRKGRSFRVGEELRNKLRTILPFKLTGAQIRSLEEIDCDMQSNHRMLRLLQGDVGSGKTIVAAMSLLNVVASGAQGVLMAPTEILARQHAETLESWLEELGVMFLVLTGRDKGRARKELLQKIEDGSAQIIIGTHALFQENIIFHDLGLAVIDEQHRFGVHQRLKLSEKGRGVDVLVMTATPIPRTLTLTAYGDMEVSRLDEKPPGRKPVDTRLIAADHLPQMIARLEGEIAKGTQIYWVCPLIEESEVMDLSAAEDRYAQLCQNFPEKVGLVHGRMKAEEKDAVMQKFVHGEVTILVATTVIEVGVNVPAATIMVIEHSERFGLAQLHQLRGRVGRGSEQSYCFLIYEAPLNETAKERLSVMRQTEDGFVIAEKDLALRGAGDVLGVRQSGLPQLRLADLEVHEDLLSMARDEAKLILLRDPGLTSDRGKALRNLLYLFERDQAISYLRSG